MGPTVWLPCWCWKSFPTNSKPAKLPSHQVCAQASPQRHVSCSHGTELSCAIKPVDSHRSLSRTIRNPGTPEDRHSLSIVTWPTSEIRASDPRNCDHRFLVACR